MGEAAAAGEAPSFGVETREEPVDDVLLLCSEASASAADSTWDLARAKAFSQYMVWWAFVVQADVLGGMTSPLAFSFAAIVATDFMGILAFDSKRSRRAGQDDSGSCQAGSGNGAGSFFAFLTGALLIGVTTASSSSDDPSSSLGNGAVALPLATGSSSSPSDSTLILLLFRTFFAPLGVDFRSLYSARVCG